MRILSVSHFYEQHGGGIERVAGHLARQFAQHGAVSAWAASDADPAPGGDIETVPLGCINPTEKLTGLPMPIPGPRAMQLLAREVRRSDAILVHDALYATSILALIMAKIYRKRVLLIQHIASIPFSSPVLRFVMKLANLIVTRPMLWAADERIFISDTVRHELLGTPPRLACQLIFNGVDSAVFHPPEVRVSHHPIPNLTNDISSPRKILFVGRYVEKKGLTVLRALAEARPDLRFHLVGSGPIRPSEWRLDNVRDLGAQAPQAIANMYREADILILPSVGEGYPLVIQEAMACGLPVICGEPTNRADPAMAEWITGVPIDLSNPQGSARHCSDAIDRLALSHSERSVIAHRALDRYSWVNMAQRIMGLVSGSQATAVT